MNKDKIIKDLKERNDKLKNQYQLQEIRLHSLEYEKEKLHKELDYADNYNIYLIAKLDKIKEYVENLLKEECEITDPDNINYGQKCQRAYFSDSELEKILELLEEIE